MKFKNLLVFFLTFLVFFILPTSEARKKLRRKTNTDEQKHKEKYNEEQKEEQKKQILKEQLMKLYKLVIEKGNVPKGGSEGEVTRGDEKNEIEKTFDEIMETLDYYGVNDEHLHNLTK